MTNLKSFILFTICSSLFIVLSTSCNLDDGFPEQNFQSNTIEIGNFELLQSSLDQIPYTGKTKVNFIDEEESIITFDITEVEDVFSVEKQLVKFNYFVQGDTVFLNHTSQTKRFTLFHENKRLTFNFNLSADPYAPNPEEGFVADVVNIFCVDPDNTLNASQVFYHETNQRTWPTTWNPEVVDQVTVLGKTFNNVYNNNFVMPKTPINYNYEFGIVSFLDLDGRLWRFDSFE